jgi:uncharacterized repeat protein (TIGR03803 family)
MIDKKRKELARAAGCQPPRWVWAIVVMTLTVVMTQPVQSQTFTVLYNFSGGNGPAAPFAGLTVDQAGNLYGTTLIGGSNGTSGTVFRLTHEGSGWISNVLDNFGGAGAGANPWARVVFGPDGALYGTTSDGGSGGNGTVFKLVPPVTVCKTSLCPWMETVIHSFGGSTDGPNPGLGDLVFDQAGNIYGTTMVGGACSGGVGGGYGTVYELSPLNDGWAETILYYFKNGTDGAYPYSGVVFDEPGNLYGTAKANGGDGSEGTVYKLTPSTGGWMETTLHAFPSAGSGGFYPEGGLIFDESGNLYGTTSAGGSVGGGTAYELIPEDGGWTLKVLYDFNEGLTCGGSLDGFAPGPDASLTRDAAGNLYGTTCSEGAYNLGNVFKLTSCASFNSRLTLAREIRKVLAICVRLRP